MIHECDPQEDEACLPGPCEDPLGRGITVQIKTDHVQNVSASLQAHEDPLRRERHDRWYHVGHVLPGCRHILVQDPDGSVVRCSQAIGEKPVEHPLQ
jgi:hypothetical protein